MKQIIHNAFVRGFKFSSFPEMSSFIERQDFQNSLNVEESYGCYYYCYIFYDSLTMKKQFILTFESDEEEDSLNLLYWDSILVLDTGKKIVLIDKTFKIVASIEITTPLIGLYVINNELLLLLEEAYMRTVNPKGEIIKSELFDLIENFRFEDNTLSITTNEGQKVISLI